MENEGSSGIGFFVIVFGGLALLSFTLGDQGLFGGGAASTTPISRAVPTELNAGPDIQPIPEAEVPRPLTFQEKEALERELESKYRQLERLKDTVAELELWKPASPHQGKVSVRTGDVFSDNIDRERLELYGNPSNTEPIAISGWKLESLVTEEIATIPKGVRLYRQGVINTPRDILLEPGERAYIISGESPIGTNFHENKCTGYLTDRQTFIPLLTRSCPRASDEMRRFGDIELKDDACYDFVNTLSTCEIPDEDEVARSNLTGLCERFLDRFFTYNQCLDRHKNEPFFDSGEWYIYLDRIETQWRTKREIIRLIDEEGRVVDILQY